MWTSSETELNDINIDFNIEIHLVVVCFAQIILTFVRSQMDVGKKVKIGRKNTLYILWRRGPPMYVTVTRRHVTSPLSPMPKLSDYLV